MSSETASMFNIVNKENKDRPGIMIIDPDGMIQYLCDDGSRILNKRMRIKQGDNIHDTQLAPLLLEDGGVKSDEMVCEPPSMVTMEKINIGSKTGNDELWIGTMEDKSDEIVFPEGSQWDVQTERLVQQLSLRYAHEILNALTPVSGILQMIKKDSPSAKQKNLIELAQTEIEKGKNYVNDFLNINYPIIPNKTWMRAGDLQTFIKQKVEVQAPEFIPYLDWGFDGKKRAKIFLDPMQLRMMIQLLVKKWVDFAKVPSAIRIIFNTTLDDSFTVQMNMMDENGIPFEIDDEFDYYLHLTKRLLEKSGGTLIINEGLTLKYFFEPSTEDEHTMESAWV